MADALLHENATVQCVHQGRAQPTTTNQRVKVGGQATITQPATYTVTCTAPPQNRCATAQFLTAATRVRSSGIPLLLKSSEAKCIPTGTGLNVITTQTRAQGT
jgi:hypothetical protein